MSESVQRGYVETSVGLVHYRRRGTGSPVVLLHQTAWNSVQYRRVMPLLAAAGLQAIALDTPGYGMSDTPEAPPSVPGYAELIAEAMSGLGLSTAAVVGHHTGAPMAAPVW